LPAAALERVGDAVEPPELASSPVESLESGTVRNEPRGITLVA